MCLTNFVMRGNVTIQQTTNYEIIPAEREVDFGVFGAVRRPGNRDSISGRGKRSSLLQKSGLALGPT